MTLFQAQATPGIARLISQNNLENFVGGRYVSEWEASGSKAKQVTQGVILAIRLDWGKLLLHVKVDGGGELKIGYLLNEIDNSESSVLTDCIVLASKNHKLKLTKI